MSLNPMPILEHSCLKERVEVAHGKHSRPVLCPCREIPTKGPWCAWTPVSLSQARRVRKTNKSPGWGRTRVPRPEDRGLSVGGDHPLTGRRGGGPRKPPRGCRRLSTQHTGSFWPSSFPGVRSLLLRGHFSLVAQLRPGRRLVLAASASAGAFQTCAGVTVAAEPSGHAQTPCSAAALSSV